MSDPPRKPVKPNKPYTGNMEDWEKEAALERYDEDTKRYNLELVEWNEFQLHHDEDTKPYNLKLVEWNESQS